MINNEHSACGVGFLTSLTQISSHQHLEIALKALENLEHRGGTNFTEKSGDGAGIMMDIPWDFFGFEKEQVAVGTLFLPKDSTRRVDCLRTLENIFVQFGLEILSYRDVPINEQEIDPISRSYAPVIKQFFIKRPENCRTLSSFDKLLYNAKQMTRTHLFANNHPHDFFFVSLSSRTITYKALCNSKQLSLFYPDLKNPQFKIKFALFHRRFSTNTISTWDKVQPFRLIAHNGEINTISGNRTWAITREKALGLRKEELIPHAQTSDSGSFNGMVEALKYRSSNTKISEIIALLVPPAKKNSSYYKFWSRAMEPWDGPALIGFCDGKMIGAHLDRNGFRPCRWAYTKDLFVLGSEAGCFELPPNQVLKRGSLSAGQTAAVNTTNGSIRFKDSEIESDDSEILFNPRLKSFDFFTKPLAETEELSVQQKLFGYHQEELTRLLIPMAKQAKEPIGSMGDTAALAILSPNRRSLFDYFYQDFAQVTNPPLDYIREDMVTELNSYLCRKPNIFEPRELLPPKKGLELKGPVISLAMMDSLLHEQKEFKTFVVDTTFNAEEGMVGFRSALEYIGQQAIHALRHGYEIVILSDRLATPTRPAIDALLALRKAQIELNRKGIRMRGSLVVDSGEIRNAHQLAVMMGHGATAVCPWLALKTASQSVPEQGEENLVKALHSGLLRIMAKVGISVLRSYQGSGLFTSLGLGKELIQEFFPGNQSLIGGIELEQVNQRILDNAAEAAAESKIPNYFSFKEHPKQDRGEYHSVTTQSARSIQQLIDGKIENIDPPKHPVNLRDLLEYKQVPAGQKVSLANIQLKEILQRFGSGAMSFGAISAESQRDIILAMQKIGGRSNSGEGGENPFYWSDGITSTVKQMASGRFGVTAEYLCSGKEIQLKMAQGAKPGEGGQLMRQKVSEDIAKARFARAGIDLISPPPMHDIYSIEDLKQLIYELKQLHPQARVSVKLVAGKNIGNISVGVVKAGADIIQISGGEGGTGAASLLSMKHCGLPWEIGLSEVHQSLLAHGLRDLVELRVDGGLTAAKDIIIATCLGAEGYDFGKLLLIAEGCIMARVCEKNNCPAGIATHDPKFKARYKGSPEKIVTYLEYLAKEIAQILSDMGVASLQELLGKTQYIKLAQQYQDLMNQKNLSLDKILYRPTITAGNSFSKQAAKPSRLNQKITTQYFAKEELSFDVHSTDRALGVHLMGEIAKQKIECRGQKQKLPHFPATTINFNGSAGQGFGAFLQESFHFKLKGESNDFVGKSMSGGQIDVIPFDHIDLEQSLVGNTCFYGATGGKAYIYGGAGDRFAIRNSGLDVMVGSVGLHACEYMTGGRVIILGSCGPNVGAGMTGGAIYSARDLSQQINSKYLMPSPLDQQDQEFLKEMISGQFEGALSLSEFFKYVPR